MWMERKRQISAAFIVMVLTATCFAMLSAPMSASEDEEPASVAAAGDVEFYVVRGTQSVSAMIVSTGEQFTLTLLRPGMDLYNFTAFDIRWTVESDWDTELISEEQNLTFQYYVESSSRTISIRVTEKANALNFTVKSISVQVLTDADDDGLPDLWERQFFGGLSSTDGTGDEDQDGWNETEEYQNGTSPIVANQRPGVLEQYWWVFALIAIVVVVIILLQFVVRPKMKTKQAESEQKKIAAAVEIEKSLLGLDMEDKEKK